MRAKNSFFSHWLRDENENQDWDNSRNTCWEWNFRLVSGLIIFATKKEKSQLWSGTCWILIEILPFLEVEVSIALQLHLVGGEVWFLIFQTADLIFVFYKNYVSVIPKRSFFLARFWNTCFWSELIWIKLLDETWKSNWKSLSSALIAWKCPKVSAH